MSGTSGDKPLTESTHLLEKVTQDNTGPLRFGSLLTAVWGMTCTRYSLTRQRELWGLMSLLNCKSGSKCEPRQSRHALESNGHKVQLDRWMESGGDEEGASSPKAW